VLLLHSNSTQYSDLLILFGRAKFIHAQAYMYKRKKKIRKMLYRFS